MAAPDEATFNLFVSHRDGTGEVVVSAHGEVDIATAPRLQEVGVS